MAGGGRRMGSAERRRIAELERQLATMGRQRAADRERERAVAEVMRLLGAAPEDTHAVFAAVLRASKRVHRRSGTLWLRDGELLRHWGTVSARIPPPAGADGERHPERDHPLRTNEVWRLVVLERRTVSIPDILAP